MGKLEKSLNDTIAEILEISPKITVAKIAKLSGVNPRSINRTNAWKNRKKFRGPRKSKKKQDDVEVSGNGETNANVRDDVDGNRADAND